MADSFVAFCQKVHLATKTMSKGHLQHLQREKVSFNGVMVNRTLWFAIYAVIPYLDKHVVALLQSIQKEFGKETLTKTYTKLYAVERLCKKESTKYECLSGQGLFTFCLEGLRLKLRSGDMQPANVKVELFEGDKKKAKRGFIDLLVAIKLICKNIFTMILDIPPTGGTANQRTELDYLVESFSSYVTYEEKWQPIVKIKSFIAPPPAPEQGADGLAPPQAFDDELLITS